MNYRIEIKVGGVLKLGITKANLELRNGSGAPQTYSDLVEIGYGIYEIQGADFAQQTINIYVFDTSWIPLFLNATMGDPNAVYVTKAGDTAIAGLLAYSTDLTITGDKTLAHKKYIDTLIATLVTLSSAQNISGAKRFLDNVIVPTAIAANHAVPKSQVEDLISEINNIPYVESLNMVRVLVGRTASDGLYYPTIAQAINYFGSPAITKQCLVRIDGTGVATQYISLSHASLVSYVHIMGMSRMVNLILGITGASVTKTLTFDNLTIWMGANAGDITTDRTYNGVTFHDCIIYAYKNLTLTNCKLTGSTIILQPSGYGVTITGTTEIEKTVSINQTLTVGTLTGNGHVQDGFTDKDFPSYSMPTDPSSTGS